MKIAEELGLTEEQVLKLGGCFGGGMCKGEVCGACARALMALGMKFGQSDIEDLVSRKNTNDITVEFLNLFKSENGSYLCRELLGCDLSTDEEKLAFPIRSELGEVDYRDNNPDLDDRLIKILKESKNILEVTTDFMMY